MASKSTPGILYVTMQPKEGLPDAQFHDWYQNEHGPNRLRLPFCNNGFRYRATDLESQPGTKDKPEWMAIYDFDELEWLTREPYTKLRSAPVQSQRERDTMKQIFVDRRSYDLQNEWKSDDFKDLQKVESEGEKNVLVAVSFTLQDGEGKEEELSKWYEDEHVALLQQVPGWRRTRRFVTSYLDLESGHKTEKEFVALHEYAPQNGLGGPEFRKALSTEWAGRIMKDVVKGRNRRVYDLYYTFGPASRDLKSLTSADALSTEFVQGLTKTHPAHKTPEKRPVIESFVTTPDGVQLPYRLEGSDDPNPPLLVLSNSILVDYGIWDDFVSHFLQITNSQYRILRYNTRGRNALPPNSTAPVTIDTLTKDVITLLDALRVKKASIVGVSLGGATALNIGLSHPNRIEAFVGCDTNAFAPASNASAWTERVKVCEKEGAKSSSGEPIVGEELAEVTVRRWFVKESYDDATLAEKIEKVKGFVKSNSLPGFRDSATALHQYDIREKMGSYKGKGVFLVGAGDGVLPKTMKENMADKLGSGVELKVVEGAGHLPMVEKPEEVARFVAHFLKG
ncbi:alpha/beta-hydrolase [Cucurbitaria berberidis CBS 394.84]|uniref:Alpha/beta-hydrolase n=1 Tax=Cucurbitaria berberidis CBS 394.84 TaxID=1168544 RepID=A0A9P4LC84_9PLEO|nr:alpha/beta-hydrolase [Cucurbitaria berberidis CBS 394.84]KAF1849112.1 alpha/beta-hydrolase [Cucurbitaria berberidis CBS 394.84]